MSDQPNNSLRKAAVFIRSLPPEAAATLIARLSHEEATALRASIAQLGTVEVEEREQVAQQLRVDTAFASQESANDSGVELSLGTAAIAAAELATTMDNAPLTDPFGSLRDADSSAIATYLAGEQPRAVALVLSYLPAETSAAVLAEYSAAEQANLLLQMSQLGEADPASVRVVAAGLSDWIQHQNQQRRLRADRLETVRAVLAASPVKQRGNLVKQLAQSDSTLASELGPFVQAPPVADALGSPKKPQTVPPKRAQPKSPPAPRLSFADLERIDGPSLVQALNQLDGRTALLALAGASEALLARLETGLPKRSTKELRRRIAHLGATTLPEVDRAQHALAAAAEKIVVARRVARVAAMN